MPTMRPFVDRDQNRVSLENLEHLVSLEFLA